MIRFNKFFKIMIIKNEFFIKKKNLYIKKKDKIGEK